MRGCSGWDSMSADPFTPANRSSTTRNTGHCCTAVTAPKNGSISANGAIHPQIGRRPKQRCESPQHIRTYQQLTSARARAPPIDDAAIPSRRVRHAPPSHRLPRKCPRTTAAMTPNTSAFFQASVPAPALKIPRDSFGEHHHRGRLARAQEREQHERSIAIWSEKDVRTENSVCWSLWEAFQRRVVAWSDSRLNSISDFDSGSGSGMCGGCDPVSATALHRVSHSWIPAKDPFHVILSAVEG